MKYNWKVTQNNMKVETNKTTKRKSKIATILGLLSAVFTAVAIIDFKEFSFNNPSDLMKLFVVVIPAIGGWVSTIK